VLQRVRRLLDPKGIMSPRSWPLGGSDVKTSER